MIVVIQCAARKRLDAGRLVTAGGKPIEFVAHPELAPPDNTRVYARPDDLAEDGVSWRQKLSDYNKSPDTNPLHLLPAYQLYEHPIYRRLADKCGVENFYILSAGWGLIRADFLTPPYDITFSQMGAPLSRRSKYDDFNDYAMLSNPAGENILFFGGRSYVPYFDRLTESVSGEKIVYYNSANMPQLPHCILRRYETTTKTNWHYECADAFLRGRLTSP